MKLLPEDLQHLSKFVLQPKTDGQELGVARLLAQSKDLAMKLLGQFATFDAAKKLWIRPSLHPHIEMVGSDIRLHTFESCKCVYASLFVAINMVADVHH